MAIIKYRLTVLNPSVHAEIINVKIKWWQKVLYNLYPYYLLFMGVICIYMIGYMWR